MTIAADKIRDLERYCRELVLERDRLTAEVARLRAALSTIALHLSWQTDSAEALRLARAALPKEPT